MLLFYVYFQNEYICNESYRFSTKFHIYHLSFLLYGVSFVLLNIFFEISFIFMLYAVLLTKKCFHFYYMKKALHFCKAFIYACQYSFVLMSIHVIFPSGTKEPVSNITILLSSNNG